MKHISLIAAACALFTGATGFCQGLSVVNPSFEAPAEISGSDTDILRGAGSSSAVPGWTITSAGAILTMVNDQNDPSNALVNQNGSQYLADVAFPELGYSGAATVSQILSTSFATGQQEYALTVLAGNPVGLPDQLGDTIFIANSSGRVLASTSLDTAPTNGSLTPFSVEFTTDPAIEGDTGPIEIGFTSPVQTNGSSMTIDDFAFYMAVPEPNSMAMETFSGVVCCIWVAIARRKSLFTRGCPKVVRPSSGRT